MVDGVDKRRENFVRLLFCSVDRFRRFRVRNVINYCKFDDVIGGKRMDVFSTMCAIVIGAVLGSWWWDEAKREKGGVRRVFRIASVAIYAMTLLYVYGQLI